MDRTITAAEAGARFAELLQDVREGGRYTVTDQGRPVATLAPAHEAVGDDTAPDGEWLDYLEELKRRPVKHIGSWTREELYERGQKA